MLAIESAYVRLPCRKDNFELHISRGIFILDRYFGSGEHAVHEDLLLVVVVSFSRLRKQRVAPRDSRDDVVIMTHSVNGAVKFAPSVLAGSGDSERVVASSDTRLDIAVARFDRLL